MSPFWQGLSPHGDCPVFYGYGRGLSRKLTGLSPELLNNRYRFASACLGGFACSIGKGDANIVAASLDTEVSNVRGLGTEAIG